MLQITINHYIFPGPKTHLTSDESASMMSISILLLFLPFAIESMPLPFAEGKLSSKESSPFSTFEVILEDFALFATSLTKWMPSATWTYSTTKNVKNDSKIWSHTRTTALLLP